MSGSARPRSRCAPPSSRRCRGRAGRGRGADDAAGAPAFPQLHASASPGCRSGSRSCRAWSRRRTRKADQGRRSPPARSRSSSAPMRCWPRTCGSSISASSIVDEEQHFGVAQKERLKQLQGRRACADADRDADPAHLATGADRRARDEHHRDAAGRPAGGAHLRHAVRSGRRARGDPARARPRRPGVLCRAAHRRSRRGARANSRKIVPEISVVHGAWPHGARAARKRDDRLRRRAPTTCCCRPTSSNRASTSRRPTR